MRRFDFWLSIELFDRIKLMAETNNIHISKMMVELLELGYIKMLENNSTRNNDFER